METMWLVVAGVLGLAVILFVTYLVVRTTRDRPTGGGRHRAPNRKRPHRDTFRTEEPEPVPLKRAGIIAQRCGPQLRTELTSQSIAAGWDEPLWLEADDVDSAARAAREALAASVDVVGVRGDSAVARGVVSVLAGTETPVAFLPSPEEDDSTESPAHTDETAESADRAPDRRTQAPRGRLALRSAGIAAAMTTALTGQNARMDIGRARLAPAPPAEDAAEDAAGEGTDESQPNGAEIVFLSSLVIGDIVADDEPALRTRTVARSLVKGTSFTATVKPDDEEAVTRPARSVAFTTRADEVAALDGYLHASQSFKGWTGVARAMMRKSSRATPLLVPMRSVAFTVTLDKPARLTVDGREIGECQPGESTISVDPLALVVRR
jgi:hypothetical protein